MDAMIIADYIIELSTNGKLNHKINNLELQKYLYYINARYMVENGGEPLFNDTIEKWKFGPVLPNVYHTYKNYGAGPIEEVSDHETVDISDGILHFYPNPSDFKKIPHKVKNMIKETSKKLSDMNPFELVELTHEHAEWKKDEYRILNGEKHLAYSPEAINDYFVNNKKAQIW